MLGNPNLQPVLQFGLRVTIAGHVERHVGHVEVTATRHDRSEIGQGTRGQSTRLWILP